MICKHRNTTCKVAHCKGDVPECFEPMLKDNTVIIVVRGGNADVLQKPKGINVLIKDWDNATLPEDADNNTSPVAVCAYFDDTMEIKEEE